MLKPTLELAGLKFGPVCARKVLVETGRLAPRKPRAVGGDSHAVRDTRTVDMFAEAAA